MNEFGRLNNLDPDISETEYSIYSENVPLTVKKRKVQCDYVHIQDFDSLELAKQ